MSERRKSLRLQGLAPEIAQTEIDKLERRLRKESREKKRTTRRRSTRRKSKTPSPKKKSPSPKKKSPSPKKPVPSFLQDIKRGRSLKRTRSSPKKMVSFLEDIKQKKSLKRISPKKASPVKNMLNEILNKQLKKTSPKRKSPKKNDNVIATALSQRRKALEDDSDDEYSSPPLFTPSPRKSLTKARSPKRTSPKASSPKRKSPKSPKKPQLNINKFFLTDVKKVKLRSVDRTTSDKKQKTPNMFEGLGNIKYKAKTPEQDDDWE
jgi:hypothetical protein